MLCLRLCDNERIACVCESCKKTNTTKENLYFRLGVCAIVLIVAESLLIFGTCINKS